MFQVRSSFLLSWKEDKNLEEKNLIATQLSQLYKLGAISFFLSLSNPLLFMAESSWWSPPCPFWPQPRCSKEEQQLADWALLSLLWPPCPPLPGHFPEAWPLSHDSSQIVTASPFLLFVTFQAHFAAEWIHRLFHPLSPSSTRKPRPHSNITSYIQQLLSLWAQICSSLKYPPLLPQPPKSSPCPVFIVPLEMLPPLTRSNVLSSLKYMALWLHPSYIIFLIFLVFKWLFLLLGKLKLSFITPV